MMSKRNILLIISLLFLCVCSVFFVNAMPDSLTLRPYDNGENIDLWNIGDDANWKCVDDAGDGDGDSTYVRSSDSDDNPYVDVYKTENHTTESDTINDVTIYIKCRSTDSEAKGYVETVLKIPDTPSYYYGSQITASTSYTLYSTTYETNPYTGNAWTWTEIDGIQIGVWGKSGEKYIGQFPYGFWVYYPVRITQVYMIVDYGEAPSKEWYKVEAWDGKLNTRQWKKTENWFGELITRQWSCVEAWFGQFITKTWNIIENWFGELIGKSFHIVDVYFGRLITLGWHLIDVWIGVFEPQGAFLIAILLLLSIAIIIILIGGTKHV